MAGGKMNYRVQMELNTKKFKAGANELRREFAALKSGFLGFTASLGASVGLFGIVSKMKDVAVNLNVARATLKNVSHDSLEYADNLKYVDRLSKDYKQDLITLTNNFAKFHAASMGTNFSLDQQRQMFESLTRAAAFYHLSAERTENMMLAVEQIMSKNKVTAEELRRQLGNVMPGAFNKMGQAAIDAGYAGVKSMADFEKAMKAGKIGADLLFDFTKKLDEETQNIDLNSLQLQLNDLKNAFTRFTENSNFEEWFKGIVDYTTKGLDFIAKHLKEITFMAKSFFTIWAGGKILKTFDTFIGTMAKLATKFKSLKALIISLFDTIHYYLLVLKEAFSWILSVPGILISSVVSFEGYFLKIGKSIRNVNKEVETLEKSLKRLQEDNDKGINATNLEAQARKDFEKAQEYLKKHKNDYEYNKALASITDEDIALAGTMGPSGSGGLELQRDTAKRLVREYEAMLDLRDKAVQTLTDIALLLGKGSINTGDDDYNGGNNDSEGAETDFEKLIKKYQKEIKELNNQFESGSITAQKYKEEAQDLAQKTWENVTAFDDFRGEIAKLDPELRKVAGELEKSFVNPYLYDAVTKLSDATKGYYEEVDRLNVLKSAGLIKNQEEYNDALQKAAEKAVEAMAGINGLANVIALLDPLTQQLIGNIISTYKKGLNDTGTPDSSKLSDLQAAYQEAITRPKVNHRFDYEKSQEEIIRAEAEAAAEWAENIKKFKEKYADELSKLSKEQLDNIEALGKQAAESATNLTDLADVTKWLEDVKNLKKEFGQGFYGSVKDTAEAMDRLTSGAKSFKKTMEDTDSTVWDKILESINMLIQSIDTVNSLVESYIALSEISKNLSKVKNDEEMRALGTKLAGETGLISVKKIELAVDKLAEAQAKKNATASLAAGAANSAEAVGGAVAAGAKIPFPQNIIAMGIGAATAAGLITGMVKMVKANFAGGGIVGGNSRHGDKVLAGLNSGEMVLNGNQQSRLWGWLSGHGTPQGNNGGKVEFVISGSNLRGVLKNEEKIRTGRS